VKPLVRRKKCECLNVVPGTSTGSQGHPSMVPKKPAKFYRENKLASKFARYQPCGESLEHNG